MASRRDEELLRLADLVDRAEGLLLQVLITGQVVPTDNPDTVRALTLDDIDLPVEINRPE